MEVISKYGYISKTQTEHQNTAHLTYLNKMKRRLLIISDLLYIKRRLKNFESKVNILMEYLKAATHTSTSSKTFQIK